MALQKFALVSLVATLAAAVDIRMFSNSDPDGRCGGNYVVCKDISMEKCCVTDKDIYSIEGRSLVTEGIPQVVSLTIAPSPNVQAAENTRHIANTPNSIGRSLLLRRVQHQLQLWGRQQY